MKRERENFRRRDIFPKRNENKKQKKGKEMMMERLQK
jgi:hypothetical protein